MSHLLVASTNALLSNVMHSALATWENYYATTSTCFSMHIGFSVTSIQPELTWSRGSEGVPVMEKPTWDRPALQCRKINLGLCGCGRRLLYWTWISVRDAIKDNQVEDFWCNNVLVIFPSGGMPSTLMES